ncbi:unnamed protein product, partial [marine sediment metagenome]
MLEKHISEYNERFKQSNIKIRFFTRYFRAQIAYYKYGNTHRAFQIILKLFNELNFFENKFNSDNFKENNLISYIKSSFFTFISCFNIYNSANIIFELLDFVLKKRIKSTDKFYPYYLLVYIHYYIFQEKFDKAEQIINIVEPMIDKINNKALKLSFLYYQAYFFIATMKKEKYKNIINKIFAQSK